MKKKKNPRRLLVHSLDSFPFSDLGMNSPFQGEGGNTVLTLLSHPFLVAVKRSYSPSLDIFLLPFAVVSGPFFSSRISSEKRPLQCSEAHSVQIPFPSVPFLLFRICLAQLDSVALPVPAALSLSNVLRSSVL